MGLDIKSVVVGTKTTTKNREYEQLEKKMNTVIDFLIDDDVKTALQIISQEDSSFVKALSYNEDFQSLLKNLIKSPKNIKQVISISNALKKDNYDNYLVNMINSKDAINVITNNIIDMVGRDKFPDYIDAEILKEYIDDLSKLGLSEGNITVIFNKKNFLDAISMRIEDELSIGAIDSYNDFLKLLKDYGTDDETRCNIIKTDNMFKAALEAFDFGIRIGRIDQPSILIDLLYDKFSERKEELDEYFKSDDFFKKASDWVPKVIEKFSDLYSDTFDLKFVDYVNFVIKFVTIIQPDKENEFKTKLSDEKLRKMCQERIMSNLEDKKFQKAENLIDIMATHILTKDENGYTDDSLKFFTELTLKYMDIMDKSKSEYDVGRVELLIGYMKFKGVDLDAMAEYMDEVSRKKFKELRINQPFFEINMYAALQSRETL